MPWMALKFTNLSVPRRNTEKNFIVHTTYTFGHSPRHELLSANRAKYCRPLWFIWSTARGFNRTIRSTVSCAVHRTNETITTSMYVWHRGTVKRSLPQDLVRGSLLDSHQGAPITVRQTDHAFLEGTASFYLLCFDLYTLPIWLILGYTPYSGNL